MPETQASLTIWVAVDRDHAPELRDTQRGDLFPRREIFSLPENATLNDAIDALIKKRHGRGRFYEVC